MSDEQGRDVRHDHDDRRDPRERPPDPAGTQPKHDPRSLLPATREPLLGDDVIEGEPVLDGPADGDDGADRLLPVRRPGAPPAPVARAAHSAYAPRFHFLFGALVAVAAAALVALVVLVAAPEDPEEDARAGWSAWRPTAQGRAGAQQVADHVARAYKQSGRQLVDVSVTPLEIDGVPLAVAVRQSAAQGGEIRVFDDGGLIYRLCGLGPSCAIAKGKPSPERHLLLRREALELALYSFRYLDGVDQVVVFMPPALGQKPSQALFFRQGDVSSQLDRPLTASLAPKVPTVRDVTLSPDATLVDQVTTPKIFRFSLTQANTDNRGFIVLDPFEPSETRSPAPRTKPKSSSSTTVE